VSPKQSQSQFRSRMIPKNRYSYPLLIKEKVEYYYYFDKWKDTIKIMNQEYIKRVGINDFGHYKMLMWYTMISWTSIWDLEDTLFLQLHPKEEVYRFTTPIRTHKRWKIPQNYHYSSGLNNPKGYK
jgi:hypothetical protein